jgi:hypothetical protein
MREITKLPAQAPAALADLSWIFPVSTGQKESFHKNGFIRFSGVLQHSTIETLNERLANLVNEGGRSPPQRGYRQAFRYCMHAWLLDAEVGKVTLARRLAGIAADLLDVEAVRLSHDHAIFKDAGASGTPIHADQYNVPLSCQIVSVWIPLQPVDLDMGPLTYYVGSHLIGAHERARLEESDQGRIANALSSFDESTEPYAVGDVSYHLGYTYHRSGCNSSKVPRNAFGIVYVADGALVTEPRGGQRIEMLSHWSAGAKVGESLMSERNPIVFRRP